MSEIIIKAESLSKTYAGKNSVEAVKNISFEINRGEIFGIIGLSGAGKSTLVRMLNLLEKPTNGKVTVNGNSLTELPGKELRLARRKIGMIFQHFNLLMQKTVLDNVAFPLRIAGESKRSAREKALKYLTIVGLEEKAKAYPSQLSGGQKQRVAIARVLTTDPDIILCDEATSALDPQTTASILELLKKLSVERNITVVVITHEMNVIRKICDRVLVLEGGEEAESGAVEEIFRNPKTEAARRLVFDGIEKLDVMSGKKKVRIVFSEESAFEPIIGNLILEYKTPVNILYANTKAINGKARGEMIIQLPEDEHMADSMIEYMRSRKLNVEEVSDYVG